jgi:predicted dehydrogenase
MSEVVYNYQYSQKLRTGFIGCGGHAYRNVYPTFQYAPVHLAAVCDLDPTRAGEFARIFGAERAYSDYREMLEKEKLDVVFIVTNYDEKGHPRYPKLAIDCMKAGAHAWIEKPPAATSEEICEMMRVSAETERYVGVGLKKMFSPANCKVKEIITRPEFGRVTSITARYPQGLPPLADRTDSLKMVGFLDHIVHPHSVLRLLGGEVEWLFVNRNDAIGSAHVSIQFKSGAIGNLHLTNGQSGFSFLERTEVIGEGTNVILHNNTHLTYYRRAHSKGKYGLTGDYFGQVEENNAPILWEPEFSLGQLYNKGIFLLGYASEVIHFTTRLLEGEGPEKGTLDDALEILKIHEAYLQPDATVHHLT